MTVIALDANFRLRRRAISNEQRDPALGSGCGYFVQDSSYQDYLKQQVDGDEVSYNMPYSIGSFTQSEGRLALAQGLRRCCLQTVSLQRDMLHRVSSSRLMRAMDLFYHMESVTSKRAKGSFDYVVATCGNRLIYLQGIATLTMWLPLPGSFSRPLFNVSYHTT